MFLYYKTSQKLYFIHLIYYSSREAFTIHDCDLPFYSNCVTQCFQSHTLRTVASECCLSMSCLAFYSVYICLLDFCFMPMYGRGHIQVQRPWGSKLVGKANMQTNFYKVGLVQSWLWIRKLLEDKEEQTFALTVQWGLKHPNCR